MSNIQSIQNALIAINETVFQDLCDSFLVSINRDYTAFSRTGSQVLMYIILQNLIRITI